MKKKEIQILKNASSEELKKKEEDLREELQSAYFNLHAGKLSNPHSIKDIKKNIARVLTFLSQKNS